MFDVGRRDLAKIKLHSMRSIAHKQQVLHKWGAQ